MMIMRTTMMMTGDNAMTRPSTATITTATTTTMPTKTILTVVVATMMRVT
jgi:hypothetical protein